jgi:hypothetical protein
LISIIALIDLPWLLKYIIPNSSDIEIYFLVKVNPSISLLLSIEYNSIRSLFREVNNLVPI